MESEAIGDWVILRRFDQSEIAHDVTTALLAMEFEASLLDLSDGTVVAGIGSRIESEHDDGDLEDVSPGRFDHDLGQLPGRGRPRVFSDESEMKASQPPASEGPWELLVPSESSTELTEVLDTLIEEQLEFEHALDVRRRRQRFTTRAVMLLGFILLSLYILLSLLKIA
jgi:hypothetical protein